MIGNIRWNIGLGIIGFITTFALSVTMNLFTTTILRSIYGFIAFFLLTFLVRWLLAVVAGLDSSQGEGAGVAPKSDASDKAKGHHVDMMTPNEEQSLQEMLRQNIDPGSQAAGEASFTPLNPPKLVSSIREENPEDLANAVRRLTES
jgi:hypothetical protein